MLAERCLKRVGQTGPLFLSLLKCYNARMDIKDTILIVSLLNLIIGVFVLARNARGKLNWSFFSVALTLSVWSASMYFYVKPVIYSSELWIKVVYFFVLCLILTWTYFFKLFLEVKERLFPAIFLLFTPIFIYLLFGTDYWVKEVTDKSWGPETILGPAYLYFGIYTGLAVAWITYFWVKKFLRSEGVARMQLLYVFISMIVYSVLAILFDVVLPLATGNSKFFWASAYFSLFFVGASAYAIFRYRLMDIRVVARQSFVYLFSFATIVGLVFGFHYTLIHFWHLSHNIEMLIIAVISAGLFHPLTNLYLKIANKYFFYSFYSYQETIKELSKKLTSILDIDKLTDTIVKEIMGVMKLDRAGVLLKEDKTDKYNIQHITGFVEENGISLVRDNFLTQRLEQTRKPVVYEELGLQIRDAHNERIKANLINLQSNMKRIEAELCLPLISRDNLKGIIVLGKKLSGEAYSVQDLNLLETLTDQASLAIENALLHDQVQDFNVHLQEKVDEQVNEIKELYKVREELLTIKENFLHIVSHQLRTPVSIFWGLLDNWKTGDINKFDRKQREKVKQQIIIAADRLQNIVNDMLDALELGRSLELEFEPVDILAMIEEVTNTLKPNYDAKKLYLKIEKPKEALPEVQASDKFLKQALMNLVDNAEKYTQTGGTTIAVKTDKESIIIEVKDTGMGLTEQDKKQIMKTQFFRGNRAQDNVPNGSGLGLYIVKQIIDKHHGEIKIDSAGVDKGAIFTIILPVEQKQGKINKKVEKI